MISHVQTLPTPWTTLPGSSVQLGLLEWLATFSSRKIFLHWIFTTEPLRPAVLVKVYLFDIVHFQSLHFWILVSYGDSPASSIPDFGFICFPPSRGVLSVFFIYCDSSANPLQLTYRDIIISSFHHFYVAKRKSAYMFKELFWVGNLKKIFRRYYCTVIRVSVQHLL